MYISSFKTYWADCICQGGYIGETERSIITRWGEINNPTHDQHNISNTTIVLTGLLLLRRPVINEHIKIPKLNDKVSRNIFLLLLKLIYCRYIYCILFIWQGSFSFSIISVCLALKDLVSICFFFNYRKYPQSFRKWFIFTGSKYQWNNDMLAL